MKRQADKLYRCAERQQGFFTFAQAVACGFPTANHGYYVRTGLWRRQIRGIYRLTRFPAFADDQYVLWSLWSRNKKGVPQGVYSHQTALSMFELSDLMPSRLHMTVPLAFRRSAPIPKTLIIHRAEISPKDVESRQGYRLTRPLRTIVDLVRDGTEDIGHIRAALRQALDRGLITRTEFRSHPDHRDLQTLLRSRRL
jgi:predicted transcriptional regulator of viral defense system